MDTRITKAEARAWMDRWRLVDEAEREELRPATIETKLHPLAAMMAMAEGLGWNTSTSAELRAVRGRWVRLKRKHRETR